MQHIEWQRGRVRTGEFAAFGKQAVWRDRKRRYTPCSNAHCSVAIRSRRIKPGMEQVGRASPLQPSQGEMTMAAAEWTRERRLPRDCPQGQKRAHSASCTPQRPGFSALCRPMRGNESAGAGAEPPGAAPDRHERKGRDHGRWRRERDLNPRTGHPASGFQDHRLQPLGHPSATDA